MIITRSGRRLSYYIYGWNVDEYCGRFWWNELKTILHFSPKIPKEWEGYSFKINFRNQS
jgi:trehalose/maltose hydrolase-like predicted phosphorylase